MTSIGLILICLLGLFHASNVSAQSSCFKDGIFVRGADATASTPEDCKKICDARTECTHWTWSSNSKGCGIRSFDKFPSWVSVPGLASGIRNQGSVYYGWLPVYKKTTVDSADQCLQACKDDNDGKCQSVTLSKNECVLNDFGNDKGEPKEEVRSSSYAVVSDCGTPKANSNCFKSGEFITSPLSHGNAYSFEDCKNNCQSSNKCQYFSWVQARKFCGHMGSEGTWAYAGNNSGIKTGMFWYATSDVYYGSWNNSVRVYKKSMESSKEACLSKCKADSQCKSLNFVMGQCLLNNFDGGYWTKVPGVVNARKSEC